MEMIILHIKPDFSVSLSLLLLFLFVPSSIFDPWMGTKATSNTFKIFASWFCLRSLTFLYSPPFLLSIAAVLRSPVASLEEPLQVSLDVIRICFEDFRFHRRRILKTKQINWLSSYGWSRQLFDEGDSVVWSPPPPLPLFIAERRHFQLQTGPH